LAFIFLTFIYVSAQSCFTISNCTDCKTTNGCGYCDIPNAIGTCFPQVSSNLCVTVGGRWNPNNCAPSLVSPCLTSTDCNSCINQTGCGWCSLGDKSQGVCHDSNTTCNAIGGSFFMDKCPLGTNCGNYSTCQDCAKDGNCTSCQITPTTFTCVSAQQKDLFCPSAFYKQGASCNVSTEALTCASQTTCEQCSGQFNSSQFNNNTQTTIKCGWCNYGSPRGGECFSTQDDSFCANFGLWNQPCNQSAAPNQTQTCTNVSGLHFCTVDILAINTTDMPGVQKLHDSYYNQQLNKIKDAVHNELNTASIGFCEHCWTAYEKWLCAAATPQCGMAECYQNAIGNATDCIQACNCDPMNEFVVQPDCYRCVMGCTNAAVGPQCGQFGLSKNSCKQLVNICGCNPKQQDAETICSDFADNGFNLDLGNDSCTGVPTWCGLSSGNQTSNWTDVTNINASNVSPNGNNSAIPPLNSTALQQAQPNRLCPNSRVCLTIYNALGAKVVANPVTTLQGVDNNGGNANNGTNSGAVAVSQCASPLLLLAGIFLLLFV